MLRKTQNYFSIFVATISIFSLKIYFSKNENIFFEQIQRSKIYVVPSSEEEHQQV